MITPAYISEARYITCRANPSNYFKIWTLNILLQRMCAWGIVSDIRFAGVSNCIQMTVERAKLQSPSTTPSDNSCCRLDQTKKKDPTPFGAGSIFYLVFRLVYRLLAPLYAVVTGFGKCAFRYDWRLRYVTVSLSVTLSRRERTPSGMIRRLFAGSKQLCDFT